MEVLGKKNMEKIHFLIFQKQNTFTKPKKLENCGNFIGKKPDDHKSRMIIKAGICIHIIYKRGVALRAPGRPKAAILQYT